MKPVEEASPVIGSIDVLRPVNGDRFLVSFCQLVEDWDAMWSACCGTRWPRLFSRWRAAGQRKWRPGLIGGVLAIGAGG
jgi:hypothetical protein